LIEHIIGIHGMLLLAVLIFATTLSRLAKRKREQVTKASNTASIHPNHSISTGTQKAIADVQTYNFLTMTTSAAICIIGYTLFYSRNADIQPWYTANYIVPILLLFWGCSSIITDSLNQKSKAFIVLFALLLVVHNISRLYPIGSDKALWPHQQLMFDAGTFLKENPVNGRVGSWNAGIIGYYGGGNIINLDGLVNNDILTYAVNNDLPSYILTRHIDYIVDFENVITSRPRRVRGGYDDPVFLSTLQPQKIFDEENYRGGYWKHLTLYRINS
jgi:hypothetical protein